MFHYDTATGKTSIKKTLFFDYIYIISDGTLLLHDPSGHLRFF